MLRQGVLGVKVKIFSDELPGGKGKKPLPDAVFIVEPKEIDAAGVGEPRSVDMMPRHEAVAPPPSEPPAYEQGGYGGYSQEVF